MGNYGHLQEGPPGACRRSKLAKYVRKMNVSCDSWGSPFGVHLGLSIFWGAHTSLLRRLPPMRQKAFPLQPRLLLYVLGGVLWGDPSGPSGRNKRSHAACGSFRVSPEHSHAACGSFRVSLEHSHAACRSSSALDCTFFQCKINMFSSDNQLSL